MKELRYRLGNEPEEYVLKEDFLGWAPRDTSWEQLCIQRIKNVKLTIANPCGSNEQALFLHQFIIKDAFPLSFFGEERAADWTHFSIVSYDEMSERFIIPLH